MATDINWINKIIEDLVDPDCKMSDIILKVKILANKLKNEKLKIWVENEINGYVGKDVPEYRLVHAGVFGNLLQDRGFGSFLTRKDVPLPTEHLDDNIKEMLRTTPLRISISEIEDMSKSEEDFRTDIPYSIYPLFSKALSNNWKVDAAWQMIPKFKIQGILTKIKSTLIDFLSEISEEIGENEDIEILKDKPKVDNIFDKTIGQIKGKTVNITIGNDNIQQTNVGEHSTANVAKGENINQEISQEFRSEVKDLLKLLEDNIDQIPLNDDDKEDIELESNRLKVQILRDKPKVGIIQNSLRVMEGILMGVTANALTPPILEGIAALLSKIG